MAFVGLWLSVVVVRRGKSSCGKNKCCLHPVIRNGYYPSPRVSKFIMQTQQKSTNDDDWNRALEKAELFSQYNQQLQQQLSQTRVRAQVREKNHKINFLGVLFCNKNKPLVYGWTGGGTIYRKSGTLQCTSG